MSRPARAKRGLKLLDPELLRSYDSYLLQGKKLSLEKYRATYFPHLSPIYEDLFEPYELAYYEFRVKQPDSTKTFTAYTRELIDIELQQARRERPEEEENDKKKKKKKKKEKKKEQTRTLPSSVSVNLRLLKQWQTQGVEDMSVEEVEALKTSMRELCRASQLSPMKHARPFDESNPPRLPSSCEHRHERLWHTHALETAPDLHGGAGPSYLVLHHNPETRVTRPELVHFSDLDQNMQIKHVFVASSGLLDWLKRKAVRFTGRGLPKGLIDYFQTTENFSAAVDLAGRVFTDEEGREYGKAQVEANLRKLKPNEINLLFALTQYMCYITKRKDILALPSGACSLQTLHALTSTCAKKDLTEPEAIAQKIVDCGLGSLTVKEKRALMRALGGEGCPIPSTANLPRVGGVPERKISTLPNGRQFKNMEEWTVEGIRQEMITDMLQAREQIKQGIVLPPNMTLEQALDLSDNLFLQDMSDLYTGDSIKEATIGVGIWLVPTDDAYEDDPQRAQNKEYFAHFFIDLDPGSKLGKLNRAAAAEAQKQEPATVDMTLITNASTRISTSELFLSRKLRKDLHTTLYAFLADLAPDPQQDKTRVVQIPDIPRSLFD